MNKELVDKIAIKYALCFYVTGLRREIHSIGEGKRRHEFAEWHVAWLAEWHNYAECHILRMTQRNKLNWKVRPFLAPISLLKHPLFCYGPDIRWQSKSHDGSLSVSLLRTATKILVLPLLVGLNGSTDTTSRKSAKIFCKVILPFYKPREKCYFFRRWVTWSWHNIQRWNGSRILFPWLRGLVFSTRS